MKDIQAFVQSHADDILNDIGHFVRHETPSTDKPRLDEFASFLADYAATTGGGRVSRITSDTSGDQIVMQVAGNGTGKPILMVGHYDTVWPVGTLSDMPFAVSGSIARGPGIFDMKTGLVQGLWALRALRETGTKHPPVVFVLNSDEEIGSPESRHIIAEQARKARAALVLEPSLDGALKTQRKGVGRYKIQVRGRAAHAGLDPTAGISAVDELARLTLDLHAQTNLETGTTVNVGVFQGGTRFNVIAENAMADVDLRVSTMQEAQRMDTLIKSLQPWNPEVDLTVEGGITWPPMKRNRAIGDLFEKARRIGRESCHLELDEASVGGASDGNTCASTGIPVLDGLGAVGGGAHATHEHINISFIPERTALVAHLVKGLQ